MAAPLCFRTPQPGPAGNPYRILSETALSLAGAIPPDNGEHRRAQP